MALVVKICLAHFTLKKAVFNAGKSLAIGWSRFFDKSWIDGRSSYDLYVFVHEGNYKDNENKGIHALPQMWAWSSSEAAQTQR